MKKKLWIRMLSCLLGLLLLAGCGTTPAAPSAAPDASAPTESAAAPETTEPETTEPAPGTTIPEEPVTREPMTEADPEAPVTEEPEPETIPTEALGTEAHETETPLPEESVTEEAAPEEPPAEEPTESDPELEGFRMPEHGETFGNEEVATAIRALYALPAFHYELTLDEDLFSALFFVNGGFELACSGEVQTEPFACHTIVLGSIEEDSVCIEDYLCAFGTGSLSSLFAFQNISVSGEEMQTATGQLRAVRKEYRAEADETDELIWRMSRIYETYPVTQTGDPWNGIMTVPSLLTDGINLYLNMGRDYVRSEETELDGRPAVCYRGSCYEELDSAEKAVNPITEALSINADYRFPTALWIDAETDLPLRLEIDLSETMILVAEEYYREIGVYELPDDLSDEELKMRLDEYVQTKMDENPVTRFVIRIDLSPWTEPIVPPVELPQESERVVKRRVLREVVKKRYSDYAMVKQNESFNLIVDREGIPEALERNMRRWINELRDAGTRAAVFQLEGQSWLLRLPLEQTCSLTAVDAVPVCQIGEVLQKIGECAVLGKSTDLRLDEEAPEGFAAAVEACLQGKPGNEARFSVEGVEYVLRKTSGRTYDLLRTASFAYVGEPLGAGFEALAEEAAEGSGEFEWDGRRFAVGAKGFSDVCTVYEITEVGAPVYGTTLQAHLVQPGAAAPETVLREAVEAILNGREEFAVERNRFAAWIDGFGEFSVTDDQGRNLPVIDGRFEADGRFYLIERRGDEAIIRTELGEELTPVLQSCRIVSLEDGWQILDAEGEEFARLLTWRVTRYSGLDSLPLSVKLDLIEAVEQLEEAGETEGTIRIPIPENIVSEDPANPPEEISEVLLVRYITGEFIVRTTVYTRYYYYDYIED